MRKFIVSLGVLIGSFTTLAQQTEFPVNGYNLPSGWQMVNSVRPFANIGRTDTFSIKIEDDKTYLITREFSDVNLIQFFVRAPQNNDDFDLMIDYSIVETDNWIPHTFFTFKSDPSKAIIDDPSDFKAYSFSWSKTGKVRFRFRMVERSPASTLLLDDFSMIKMTTSQTAQFATEATLKTQMDELKKTTTDEIAFANYAVVQNRFREAATNTKRNVRLLSNLIEKSSGIYHITGVGEKIAIRNQMVNPWSYSSFQTIVNNLNTKLPQIKQENLSDILNLIKAPLMLADKVLLGGTLSTFATSIKGLIGDAYTKSNLKEIGIPVSTIGDEVRKGIKTYSDVKTFLEVIIKENERVNYMNGTLSEMKGDSELLMKDSEKQLLEYLKFINMSNPEQQIANLKTSPNATRSKIDSTINSYYQSKVGLPGQFVNNQPLSAAQYAVFDKTVSLSNETDDLRKRYPQLTNNLTNFLRNLKSDAEVGNPFKKENGDNLIDQVTTNKWDEFKSDLRNGLEALSASITTTYVGYNMYD